MPSTMPACAAQAVRRRTSGDPQTGRTNAEISSVFYHTAGLKALYTLQHTDPNTCSLNSIAIGRFITGESKENTFACRIRRSRGTCHGIHSPYRNCHLLTKFLMSM